MTQSPLQPPNDPDRSEESAPVPTTTDSSRPLGFDEMVAVFIAFLSLGGVLMWGLTRGNLSIFSDSGLPADSLTVTPDTGVTGSGTAAPGTAAPDATDPGATAGGLGGDITSADRESTDDVDFENMSAREELIARAAIRRERLAAERSRPLLGGAGPVAAGAAAGVAAAPNSVSAEGGTVGDTAAPAVAASETATAEPKEALLFSDVPDDYWAKPYIDALSSRGLISGYDDGTFKPDQPVTRAQTAAITSRTFDLTSDKETLEFSDVAADYWARESIGEVVKGGFMTGFPDDTFQPNLPITRAQALTTLVTGLGIEMPQNVQAALSRYTDANAIPQWANEKVAAATSGSLVVNHPNPAQLNPEQPTTRAELSAMIYQALVREGVVEPVESQYVVKP